MLKVSAKMVRDKSTKRPLTTTASMSKTQTNGGGYDKFVAASNSKDLAVQNVSYDILLQASKQKNGNHNGGSNNQPAISPVRKRVTPTINETESNDNKDLQSLTSRNNSVKNVIKRISFKNFVNDTTTTNSFYLHSKRSQKAHPQQHQTTIKSMRSAKKEVEMDGGDPRNGVQISPTMRTS